MLYCMFENKIMLGTVFLLRMFILAISRAEICWAFFVRMTEYLPGGQIFSPSHKKGPTNLCPRKSFIGQKFCPGQFPHFLIGVWLFYVTTYTYTFIKTNIQFTLILYRFHF